MGCGGPAPKFCYGSFEDILLRFIRGHSDSGMGRTSAVHKGDFLGLMTSMRWLIFCSVQSDSVCNSPILSSNTIYTGILIIWVLVSYYMHCALHTLLIEYHTHVYSYIAGDSVDIWVREEVLTFGLRRVYISILTLWFSFDWEFYTHFDCTFSVWIYERPTEYELCLRTYFTHMYIYGWSFR